MGHQIKEVEAMGGAEREQQENPHQHQQTADHGVEDILERGVDPPLPAPNPQHEVGRDQDRFPEEVEQYQVDRHEDPNQGPLQKQQHAQVDVAAITLGRAGNQDTNRREDSGEEQKQDAHPIDRQMKVHMEGANP